MARDLRDRIPLFSGEGGHNAFQKWLKEMRRTQQLQQLSDAAMRQLTSASVRGTAADYVARLFEKRPNIAWAEIQKDMKERYSDLCDALLARQTLKNIKQKPGESVQSLYERIIQAGHEAFSSDQKKNPVVLQQMMDVFLRALSNEHIARKLINRRPNTLEKALDEAIRLQRNDVTFEITRNGDGDLGRIEEPMDCSYVSTRGDAGSHVRDRDAEEGQIDSFSEEALARVEEIATGQEETYQLLQDLSCKVEDLTFREQYSDSEGSEYEVEGEETGEEQSNVAYLKQHPKDRAQKPRSGGFQRKYPTTAMKNGQNRAYGGLQGRNSKGESGGKWKPSTYIHNSGKKDTRFDPMKRPSYRSSGEGRGMIQDAARQVDTKRSSQSNTPLKWDGNVPICARCGQKGHIRKECVQRRPVGWKPKSTLN